MAVSQRLDRKAFEVVWTEGLDSTDQVKVFFINPADLSDISNTDPRENDGSAVATVPADFSGEINVEVRTATDGNLLDSGTITL